MRGVRPDPRVPGWEPWMSPVRSGRDTQARVLVALCTVHATTGRATVRQVAAAAGRSVQVTHRHLSKLAEGGLVAWDETTVNGGTLRPLVEIVACNR